ncbi:hypothetical protein D9613_000823 [Agrocybe pediades]|uniref:Uncharacterized protein n=1 Tax=Agrocybe pediades TaxID=84607 RepID=A0A8H4R171_9AGAR|nr:hypothetical protein D9613_000823 [Agrocybe pediades]
MSAVPTVRNSFQMQSSQRTAVTNSVLLKAELWCTDTTFQDWKITLTIDPSLSGLRYIHISLRPSQALITYSAGLPIISAFNSFNPTNRQTIVDFTLSSEARTTAWPVEIISMPFVSGITFGMLWGFMIQYFPFYEAPNSTLQNGSPHWSITVLHELVATGQLMPLPFGATVYEAARRTIRARTGPQWTYIEGRFAYY